MATGSLTLVSERSLLPIRQGYVPRLRSGEVAIAWRGCRPRTRPDDREPSVDDLTPSDETSPQSEGVEFAGSVRHHIISRDADLMPLYALLHSLAAATP
jgi:hypothetical protein